ncbi:hypothetical protein Ahy_A04g018135 isoform B [Arachis hypogaea]|uniref:Uncharacterized protein n=1 Tax=Arachis hypogaea TaxID=3818 RepID=A0A445DCX8_ARAHY|nr:hypothetical protein Ahy_A04g018135 isoform B [Arachis hypogaea]
MQTGSCAYENPAFVFDGELYLPKLSFMSLFNFHVASVSLQKSAIFFQFETSFLSNYVKVQLSDKRIHIGPAFNQVHLELLSEDLSVQVLFDLFHHDVRLWKAYSTMLQPADSFKIYWKRRLLQ